MQLAFKPNSYSSNEPVRLHERKLRVFQQICETPSTTRKRIAEQFGLRPATISNLVGELIDANLVQEARVTTPHRQGRPEVALHPVPDSMAVVVVYVVSNEIMASLVSFGGARLASVTAPTISASATNDDITEEIIAVIERLRAQTSIKTKLIGISLSLPGIVDESGKRWVFSTRWPNINQLGFDRITQTTGLDVTVSRSLNSELRGRLARRPDEQTGGVLLVHWGYGIGASYAYNGDVLHSGFGGFGEVGHWKLRRDCSAQCYCGNSGCLETEAALWALLPKMKEKYGDVPLQEDLLGDFLEHADPKQMAELQYASELMVGAIHNMFMMLFPRRLVLTGPFMRNKGIRGYLIDMLNEMTPNYLHEKPEIQIARENANDEVIGASTPVFMTEVRTLTS